MLGLSRKKVIITPESCLQSLRQNPYHQWLIQDRYAWANFCDFVDSLDRRGLECLKDILFLKSHGQWSLALHAKSDERIILIFPELLQELRSCSPSKAFAVLAHELGHHIFNHHQNKSIGFLKAQIEADQYAQEMGHGQEIEEILLSPPSSEEKRIRLTYLVSRNFKV